MTENSSDKAHRPITADGSSLDAVLAEAMRFFRRRESMDRSAIRWARVRKFAWVAFFGVVTVVQLAFLVRMVSGGNVPTGTAVAVIPIEGPIAPNGTASAAKIVPMIEKACESPKVSDIVLAIDSPGGAPYESERIVRAMESCRADHKKKFTSLIASTGASAAYMIAVRGDQLVAGHYSIVGSIGAIMRYVDASGAVTKFGLNERVFRSGSLKGGPSMLSGSNAQLDAVNQEMVTVLGRDFLEEVVAQRKGRLKMPKEELFTGRIWTGPQALEAGLIDRLATLEDLKRTDFKDKQVDLIRPKTPFAEGLGMRQMLQTLLHDVLFAAEQPRIE